MRYVEKNGINPCFKYKASLFCLRKKNMGYHETLTKGCIVMHRFAMRITEDTLLIISKLNEVEILPDEMNNYVLFVEDKISSDLNCQIMSSNDFFLYFPQADKQALLQFV